jgi:hypothetical protein
MADASTVANSEAGKTTDQLRAERQKRILDATEMRQPDRIPIIVPFGSLLADMEGITRQELYNSPEKARIALGNAALRFQPDAASGAHCSPGPSRVLGDRMTKWPGNGLSENSSFQFHEGEYMKAEDYDAFIADPADWSIRVYLPRVFSELEGLSLLPHLGMAAFGYYAVSGESIRDLVRPPVSRAFQALFHAANVQAMWFEQMQETAKYMHELGFASTAIGGGELMAAPFDFMSDTMRGMRGIFLDMRRCPDKLLAAEEKVLQFQVENAIARCKARGSKFVGIPLHRGSDGFISLPAFEKFYWPQLKSMLVSLIDADIRPFVFFEGVWDQRLHYLAELPKGKILALFQNSNIFKVKEILGEVMCIMGGMPVGLLAGGAPEDIREHTRKVCQIVGKGGAFIMHPEIGELEGCKPDLIQVWVDATKEYGVY